MNRTQPAPGSYVSRGSMRNTPPMNDAAWRLSVKADAIKAGVAPDLAEYIAANVGKDDSALEFSRMSPDEMARRLPAGVRAALNSNMSATAMAFMNTVNAAASDYADRLRRMCAVYGDLASALVPEFEASRVTLGEVRVMLGDACGGDALDAAGADRVRIAIVARDYFQPKTQ